MIKALYLSCILTMTNKYDNLLDVKAVGCFVLPADHVDFRRLSFG
jgi:Flp pilus assembly protein CpaB